jgi:uncharacterized protein (DUF1499 family)
MLRRLASEEAMSAPSRVASLSAWLGIAAVALAVAGPVSVWSGLAEPLRGFRTFGFGLLAGLLALLVGLVALWLTRPASGRGGRSRARIGVGLGGALLLAVILPNLAAFQLPPINDITTSPGDPPLYVEIAGLEPNRGRDMGPAGPEFEAAQRAAYPDLAPIRLDADPTQAFTAARRAAVELGWEIIAEDPATGRLEATDTSQLFQFVDDVAVRIRPADGGVVIDVRSKSRDGRGDLGANADRIRAFRDALAG